MKRIKFKLHKQNKEDRCNPLRCLLITSSGKSIRPHKESGDFLGRVIFTVLLAVSAVAVFSLSLKDQRELRAYNEAGGEIVAIFEQEISPQELDGYAARYEGRLQVIKHIDDYALFHVKDSSYFNDILNSLRKEEKVAQVQANVSVSSLGFSNDTYADAQWAISNPGHYIYVSEIGRMNKPAVKGMDMDVIQAWELLENNPPERKEVIVAVIDTGVDYNHPDLAGHMWINPGEIPGDNIDNDNNGYVDDVYGWDFYNDDATVCHYSYSDKLKMNIASNEDNDDHGTHVAGIIGATLDNGIGIAGVASKVDVKIMSLKINGGPKGTGNLASAVEAVKYATRMGADICNLSWGTSSYTASLEQVMKESDMLFIAAAGNTGDDNNNAPVYPASLKLDNLISVTFVDSAGELTGLSNYGSNTVDLAAPGEDILSTIVGNYSSMSGSSMAAPQVSAVAALLYAYSDHIYPSEVKNTILENIKPLPKLEKQLRYAGMPSAYQALLAAGSLEQDTQAPLLSLNTSYEGSDMLVSVGAEDAGGSGVRVVRWSSGEKSAEDFARGMSGSVLEESRLRLSKAGKYTFYSSDYAGNEMVQVYEVLEDTTGPKLSVAYTVADNYSARTVTVRISDPQSGVRRLKYMPGKRKAQDFLPEKAGIELKTEKGKASFKVAKDGVYTIFGIDNRGNMSVKTITVQTVKSTAMKPAKTKRTMHVDDTYTLLAYLTPSYSTDRITYTSSDEKVASVTTGGKITALKEGTATIILRTSSGRKATCKITVLL